MCIYCLFSVVYMVCFVTKEGERLLYLPEIGMKAEGKLFYFVFEKKPIIGYRNMEIRIESIKNKGIRLKIDYLCGLLKAGSIFIVARSGKLLLGCSSVIVLH